MAPAFYVYYAPCLILHPVFHGPVFYDIYYTIYDTCNMQTLVMYDTCNLWFSVGLHDTCHVRHLNYTKFRTWQNMYYTTPFWFKIYYTFFNCMLLELVLYMLYIITLYCCRKYAFYYNLDLIELLFLVDWS